jgi:hypothetical protein
LSQESIDATGESEDVFALKIDARHLWGMPVLRSAGWFFQVTAFPLCDFMCN